MSSRNGNDSAVAVCRDLEPATPPDVDLEAGRPLDETRHGGFGTAPAGLPLP